jgi:hypothetical protein
MDFHLELVRPVLPLHFYTAYTFGYKNIKLFVPHRSLSPYGQQGTIHFRSALWALLLPVTIEQKVSDIFRSYVMQVSLISIRIDFDKSPFYVFDSD